MQPIQQHADILSTKECLSWMRGKFWKQKKWNPTKNRGGELPINAFCRVLKMARSDVHNMLTGKDPIPKSRHPIISRFIKDWENGMLEFDGGNYVKGRNGMVPRYLVHRTEPAKRAPRMTIDLDFKRGVTPSIRWIPKPKPNIRLPEFKDAFELMVKKA